MSVALSGNDLTFLHLHDVALRGAEVQLTASAIERMNASRAVVERLVASGATAYGIIRDSENSLRCASLLNRCGNYK